MQFYGMVYQQRLEIHIDTNCAPFIPNLVIYSYETDFCLTFTILNGMTSRYLDDIFSVNNPEFDKLLSGIFTVLNGMTSRYLDDIFSVNKPEF